MTSSYHPCEGLARNKSVMNVSVKEDVKFEGKMKDRFLAIVLLSTCISNML